MSLVCCCQLAGTMACRNCPRYIEHFGYTEQFYPYKVYPTPTFEPLKQQGWICPKCGAVLAPFMPHCDKCPSVKYPNSEEVGGK